MSRSTNPAPTALTPPRWPAVPRPTAFWLVAFVYIATVLGTTLPTPLYVIYQARWHFSATILTVIFAFYAAGVLVSLLLAGRSSDQAGRKPVLAAAVGCSALSTVLFIVAPDPGVLFVARILSGFSVGLMNGTATAMLTDLAPASSGRRASLVAAAANMGGLGLGSLIAGLFAQYASHPTVVVFDAYLALLAAAGLCVLFLPETVSPRRRPTLRFAGLGIPERGRSEFLAAGLAGFAAFSLIGLFSSLAPTFLGSVLHEPSHLVGGALVFLVFEAGTVTQIVLSRFDSRRVVIAGLGLFLPALALIVAALFEAGMALFLAGAIVAGVGVGAAFMGSLAIVNRLASPERRSQAISTYFVMNFTGLIIPVIGVGMASGYIGDFSAVLAFSVLLAALCVFALARIRGGHSSQARDAA